jgi:DNA topoisomerase-3
MKRFADSLARQKGIKPPPGYKTSISICRKFLNEHAPKKAEGEATGKNEPKPVSPAQLLYAKKIAQGKGLIIPDEAKANSAAMSVWIDSNRSAKRRKRGRPATTKRSRKRKAYAAAAPPAPAQPNSVAGTPLRIPYGNKDVAMKLGARYGSSGWYAPPGVDLSAFGERGWLSGLKWSSQHPDEGGCDEDSKAAFGSVWAGTIVVARSTLRGRTR